MTLKATAIKIRCTFCGRQVGRNPLTLRPAAHKLTEETAQGGHDVVGDWCPGSMAGY
jgi:hypothetical protein